MDDPSVQTDELSDKMSHTDELSDKICLFFAEFHSDRSYYHNRLNFVHVQPDKSTHASTQTRICTQTKYTIPI